jgi:glycerate-2-kinase
MPTTFEATALSPQDLPRNPSNFRDLGLYTGEGGRHMRPGRIYRSDHFGALSADDIMALQPLGIARVLDFRGTTERLSAMCALPQVQVHSLAIEPTVVQVLGAMLAAGEPITTADVVTHMQDTYRGFVRRNSPRFAELFGHLLASDARGRTLVLGAGKAGGSMAQALEALWPPEAPLSGLVVTRYGHVPPRPDGLVQRIEVVEAAHPVPDAAGMAAAERMLALTAGLTADDLVLCLVSGGGSSLLTLPADGLALADKQRINRALLESGASIGEMNCVRKHLSRIKGGRLAAACAPARVVTLAISDVPGDDPSVIASGPTVPDATTCADALEILARYRIDVPPPVRQALQSGALETPKPADGAFAGHSVHLVATPWQALEAAAAMARGAGLAAYILSDEMEGESREVGRVHAALARGVA